MIRIPCSRSSIGRLPIPSAHCRPRFRGGELQRESTTSCPGRAKRDPGPRDAICGPGSSLSRGRAGVATQRGCALLRLLEIVEEMQVVGCNCGFDFRPGRKRQIGIDARDPDLSVSEPNGEKLLVAELLG